jgi:Zn-dependent protease with chaperone function
LDWIEQGAERQSKAAIVAIFAAWAGLPLSLWLAALGLVAGVLAGIVGAEHIGLAHTLHVDEGVGVVGAFIGGIAGAVGGLLLILVGYIHDPAALLGALVSGIFITFMTLAVLVLAEPRLLPLRGYRVLSRREKERLYPLLQDVGQRMGLAVVPELRISDRDAPAAWCHMRAIVVTEGLLGDYDASEVGPRSNLDRAALSAILAHELHHWSVGDAVGNAAVWSGFWPVVVLYNAAAALRERAGWLGTVGWILFWPAWVITKLIVVPIMARQSREYEYEADARAASLGDDIRLGLRRALTDLRDWEKPRTGWEEALSATHPPVELRLERLEAPGDAELELSPDLYAPVRVSPLPGEYPSGPVPVAPPPPPPVPDAVDGDAPPRGQTDSPTPGVVTANAEESGVVNPTDGASTAESAPQQPAEEKPSRKRAPKKKSSPPRASGDGNSSDAAAQWGLPPDDSDTDTDERE